MSGLSTLDIVLLAAYAAVIFTLGAVGFRRVTSTSEYFAASRRAGWVSVGMSLMVSLASSLGYIAAPAAAHRTGLMLLWSLAALPLAYPVVVYLFIPYYCRLNASTAYEHLEQRFDRSVRLLSSGLFIAWRVVWMGAVLYAPALAVAIVTDGALPVPVTVFALGLFATAYTMIGGLRGVLWADRLQFVVMFGGVAVTLVAVSSQSINGLAGLWHSAASAGALRVTAPSTFEPASVWTTLRWYVYTDFTVPAIVVGFTLGKLANYGVDQMLVQRFLSARSTRAAVHGFLFNCVAFALFFTLMTATGIAIRADAVHRHYPAALAADAMFPYYVAHYAPAGLAGLMLAGLFAAAISSFDSGVHACATAVCNDFLRTPNDTDKLRAGRFVALMTGVGAILLGCVVGFLGDAFEIALKVVNSFAGPLLAIFVLGVFSARANTRGVWLGAALGVAVAAILVVAGPVAEATTKSTGALAVLHWLFRALDIGFLWVSTVAFATTLVSGYVASVLQRREPSATVRHAITTPLKRRTS